MGEFKKAKKIFSRCAASVLSLAIIAGATIFQGCKEAEKIPDNVNMTERTKAGGCPLFVNLSSTKGMVVGVMGVLNEDFGIDRDVLVIMQKPKNAGSGVWKECFEILKNKGLEPSIVVDCSGADRKARSTVYMPGSSVSGDVLEILKDGNVKKIGSTEVRFINPSFGLYENLANPAAGLGKKGGRGFKKHGL